MSAIKNLQPTWKNWISECLIKGVKVDQVAITLFEKGWIDAAYELMESHKSAVTRPFIDLSQNHIDLTDRHVPIVSVCYKPLIVVFDNFLSEDECQQLIDISTPKMGQAKVVSSKDGAQVVNAARSSLSAGFLCGEKPINEIIERRIAELINWPIAHGEGLNVLRYEDGGEYRPHHDYFDPALKGSEAILARGGQRVGTFLMYLSEVEAGGSTQFPSISFEVRPKLGRAVYFANTKLNGELDATSLHAGMPVTKGVKFLATKWLRERPYQPKPAASK